MYYEFFPSSCVHCELEIYYLGEFRRYLGSSCSRVDNESIMLILKSIWLVQKFFFFFF